MQLSVREAEVGKIGGGREHRGIRVYISCALEELHTFIASWKVAIRSGRGVAVECEKLDVLVGGECGHRLGRRRDGKAIF